MDLRRGARWLGVVVGALGLAAATALAAPPQGNFTITPNPPNQGDPTVFKCEPCPASTTVDWDLTGGTGFETTNTPTVTVTFSTVATRTMRMRLTRNGEVTIVSRSVTVNGRPTVSFNFSPSSPLAGQTVAFTSQASDPENNTITRTWTFGDGATATGTAPTHAYAAAGTYTVSVKATDSRGASSTATQQITVKPDPGPTASFTFSPTVPDVGESARFTASAQASQGSIVDLSWDLDGDGQFDDFSGPVADWAFDSAGTHQVRLRAEQTNGKFTVSTQTLRVNALPAADFGWNPTAPIAGESVELTSTSSDFEGPLASLSWDLDGDGNFGDGSGSQVSKPFPTAGTFEIGLRVTDSDGAVSTVRRQVTVSPDPGPTASFTSLPTVPNTGEAVDFTASAQASQGSIVSLSWDLDADGEFDDFSGPQADWAFDSAGTHVVRLRAEQTNGRFTVSEASVRVNGVPSADFSWSPSTPVAGGSVDLVSTSSDFEGPLASLSWDLDGDGLFGDGSGSRVRLPVAKPGTYEIGLQVTDSDGTVSTVRKRFAVAAPPTPPTQPAPDGGPTQPSATPRPRLMSPFPVVRIAGTVLPHGALISVLSVRAPRGSHVRLRCEGAGCPVGSLATTSATRLVRFRRFERRLRAGILLKLFVRQDDRIGKYTSFLIRAGAPPKRVDMCLYPARRAPRRCR